MGIHDKRILKIIQQMLKAGYIDYDLFCKSERGVSQGGVISPLLSNVYLNDVDWYIGRKFYHSFPHCKHIQNDTRRLKWMGVTPKYNIRFAVMRRKRGKIVEYREISRVLMRFEINKQDSKKNTTDFLCVFSTYHGKTAVQFKEKKAVRHGKADVYGK